MDRNIIHWLIWMCVSPTLLSMAILAYLVSLPLLVIRRSLAFEIQWSSLTLASWVVLDGWVIPVRKIMRRGKVYGNG